MRRFKASWRLWVLVGLLVLTVFLIKTRPEFKLKNIVITGTQFVDKKWVFQVLNPTSKDNVVFYPRLRMNHRLQKKIPPIHHVKFHVNIFTRTLEVRVVERTSFASVIAYPFNYIVDKKGVILNVNQHQEVQPYAAPPTLPIITGIPDEQLKKKIHLHRYYQYLLEGPIAMLIDLFGKDGIKFNIADSKDIRVLTNDLIELKLGDTERMKDKLRILRLMLVDTLSNNEKVEYIDVRFPDYPVLRFYGGWAQQRPIAVKTRSAVVTINNNLVPVEVISVPTANLRE